MILYSRDSTFHVMDRFRPCLADLNVTPVAAIAGKFIQRNSLGGRP
jgi:hypothetical protein